MEYNKIRHSLSLLAFYSFATGVCAEPGDIYSRTAYLSFRTPITAASTTIFVHTKNPTHNTWLETAPYDARVANGQSGFMLTANVNAEGNLDGTFVMHPDGHRNLCVTYGDAWSGSNRVVSLENCDNSDRQKLFVQRTGEKNVRLPYGSEQTYLIRSVAAPGECFNLRDGSWKGNVNLIWYRCQWKGAENDRWTPVGSSAGLERTHYIARNKNFDYSVSRDYAVPGTKLLAHLADIYAVTRPIKVGQANPVTSVVMNGQPRTSVSNSLGGMAGHINYAGTLRRYINNNGSLDQKYSIAHGKSTSSEFSYGFSQSVSSTTTIGNDASPIQQQFMISFGSNQQFRRETTENTVSTHEISIPAREGLWISYGASKTISGVSRFRISNDVGNQWLTDEIHANLSYIPDDAGVDFCFTSSPSYVCRTTKPKGTL